MKWFFWLRSVPVRLQRGFLRAYRHVADHESIGTLLAAVLTILGAWLLTEFVQRRLDDREARRNELQEKVKLIYEVTRDASSATGLVYWRGLELLEAFQWKVSNETVLQRQSAMAVEHFNEAVSEWRSASRGWSASMRFLDGLNNEPVGESAGRWQELEEQMEEFIDCVGDTVNGYGPGREPCSADLVKIETSIDRWIDSLPRLSREND